MTPEQQAAIQRARQRAAIAAARQRIQQGGGMAQRLQGMIDRGEAGIPPERRAAMERANAQAEASMQQAGRARMVRDEPVFSGLAAAVQGVPFVGEYVDEAAGMVSTDARDRIRAAQQGMDENRPGLATGLRIGTGVASALPAAAMTLPRVAAGGAGLAGQTARGLVAGMTAGGVEGAVSGYGAGNDESRTRSAAERGLVGAALGGGIGAVAPAAAQGVRSLLRRFRTSDIQTIAREFGVSEDAARVVRSALDAEDFDAAQAAIERAGGRAMLADAGQATAQQLDSAMQSGSLAGLARGRRAVEARAAEGGREFTRVLDRFFGQPQGVRTTQAGIRQGTAAARREAYESAYASPINYADDAGATLERLWQRVPASVRQRAARLMQIDGHQSQQVMASIAPDGSVTYSRPADVRQWDYITRALNDMAESGETRGAMGGMTAESRAVSSLSREIRDTLRGAVPAYGEALDAGADAIGRIRAVEVGANLLRPSMTREQAEEAFRGMSAAERTAARQGLRDAIDDLMARTNAALTDPNMDAREAIAAWRALSSRRAQDNIAALMGEGRARGFAREVDRIASDFQLRAAVARNSATAIRQNMRRQADEITQGTGILANLGRGDSFTQTLIHALTGRDRGAEAARQAGIYDEIVEALTRTRGAREARRVLGAVRESIGSEPISEGRARYIARLLTTGAAGGAYQTGTQLLAR